MATIAIIGALEKEIMQIKEELSDVCEAREAGLTVVSGELDDLTVVATTAGMGTVNAAAATQHLISKYAPQAVVFSGIAGGLNPKLHINDVVIGKCLRYLDTDTALIAESAPGLEEFVSTPALADVAAAVLAEHGFVDVSLDVAAAEKDPSSSCVALSPRVTALLRVTPCVTLRLRPRMPIASRWRARQLRTSRPRMVSIAWCCALSAIIATRHMTRFASASSIWMSTLAPRAASRLTSFVVSPPRNSTPVL